MLKEYLLRCVSMTPSHFPIISNLAFSQIQKQNDFPKNIANSHLKNIRDCCIYKKSHRAYQLTVTLYCIYHIYNLEVISLRNNYVFDREIRERR